MKLSIIIPAFNEEILIEENLNLTKEALANSKFRRNEWEIIVCNNNSSDKTEKIAQSCDVIVVFEEHNQISRARNTGAQSACGDWLLFIDADSYPTPELMGDVYNLVSSDRCAGGGSTMQFSGKPTHKTTLILFLVNHWMRFKNFAAGAFFICKRDDFKTVGGFNTELYAAEDLDLSNKLKRIKNNHNKSFTILHENPFITSPRKFELYSVLDRCKFYWGCIIGGKSIFKDRNKLSIWYDG